MENVEVGDRVWIPYPASGYTIGTVYYKNSGNKFQNSVTIIHVTIEKTGKIVAFDSKHVHLVDDNLQKDKDDNYNLMYLNEGNLLHNLKLRYDKKNIYTYLANHLILINPCQHTGHLNGDKNMKKYKSKTVGVEPPHVFAIAEKVHQEMVYWQVNQAIMFNGESGSGKTEAMKNMLNYLAKMYGDKLGLKAKQITECNLILEAFGHARTLKNTNATRFGTFFETHFDEKHELCGGRVWHYILDRTRICQIKPKETNYHVFYYLLQGAKNDMLQKLQLSDVVLLEHMHSKKEMRLRFNDLDTAMTHMSINQVERESIYTLLAALVHLGNVKFVEQSEHIIDHSTVDLLNLGADMIGISSKRLLEAVTFETVRGNKIHRHSFQAKAKRDELCKYLYSKLVGYIIKRMNLAIAPENSNNFIGFLDIPGFENVNDNGFDQFAINYFSEIFQQFVLDIVFKKKQQLYNEENISFTPFEYSDNYEIIVLQEGILDILDESVEQCHLPEEFCENVVKHYGENGIHQHSNFDLAKYASTVHELTKESEACSFLIKHFAGEVVYDASNFVTSNIGALSSEMNKVLVRSKFSLLQILLNIDSNTEPDQDISNCTTVGYCIRKQMYELLEMLKPLNCTFVRCIKPNESLEPKNFDGECVLRQLNSLGLSSLMKQITTAYPDHISLKHLYRMYGEFFPPGKDPEQFFRILFLINGFGEEDFVFGRQKVFFRPGKSVQFHELAKADDNKIAQNAEKVLECWKLAVKGFEKLSKVQMIKKELIKAKEMKEETSDYIIFIQSVIRTAMKKKVFDDRLKCAQLLNGLCMRIDSETSGIIQKLTIHKTKAGSMVKQLKHKIVSNMDRMRKVLMTLEDPKSMATLYEQYEVERIALVKQLQDFLNLEEEEFGIKTFKSQQLLKDLAKSHEMSKRMKESSIKENVNGNSSTTYTTGEDELEKEDRYTSDPNRYFLVPFVHRKDLATYTSNDSDKHEKGYLLGHYSYGKIQRQLELHYGKKPIAYMKGYHDSTMSRLTLAESGMLKIERAEIPGEMFEKFWNRFSKKKKRFNGRDPETALFLKMCLLD